MSVTSENSYWKQDRKKEKGKERKQQKGAGERPYDALKRKWLKESTERSENRKRKKEAKWEGVEAAEKDQIQFK